MTTSSLVDKHPLKEKRKANKPLLERKRRARINDCLTELKQLVLTSLNKDISRFNKMEKADVLDMTVQYLKASKMRKTKEDGAVSFQAGFNECASEIISYIIKLDDVDHLTKAKLLSYLATSCKLTESVGNSNNLNQSRTVQPLTCSVSSQSPDSIIPSPTSSSPQSIYSPVAVSGLSHHTGERNIFAFKQLSDQTISPITQTQRSRPKVPFAQQDYIPSSTKTQCQSEPKLWRPW